MVNQFGLPKRNLKMKKVRSADINPILHKIAHLTA